MPRGHMARSRCDVAGLVVKEEVGFKFAQKGAFLQPAQKHGFIHADAPVQQRAHRAFVGGCAAGRD
ncbi:hypothetical protein D3C71_2251720 [compost metagenome]